MTLSTSISTSSYVNPTLYNSPILPIKISTVFTPPPECATRLFTDAPRIFDWDEPMWDKNLLSTETLTCSHPVWLSAHRKPAGENPDWKGEGLLVYDIIGPCPHGYTTIGTRVGTSGDVFYDKDPMLWYTTAYCCPP
jgi:hypothetical protein